MKTIERLLALVVVLSISMVSSIKDCYAQKVSFGTNIIDYLNLGTINAEGQVALSRHVTLALEGRYNDFVFDRQNTEKHLKNNRHCLSLGVKYWPWVSLSGWYLHFAGQAQDFSRDGLGILNSFSFDKYSVEGWNVGFVAGGGYSYMLTKFLNLDFGVDGWTGYEKYSSMLNDGQKVSFKSGQRLFVMPCNIRVGLSFVFGKAKENHQ